MFRIETDHKRKFIRVTVQAFLKPHEARDLTNKLIDEMRALKGQGFSTLLDFRQAATLPPEVADLWVEVAKHARMMGLHKSARLVSSATMQAQVNWVGREAHNSDVVRNFTDEAEAIRWLRQ
ncbi:MAG: hypothetical protein AB1631_19545 [Acidobacteriota bacterium]